MHVLYNSDSYTVLRLDAPADGEDRAARRGGFEIMNKFARRGIFLEGALAEAFQAGVQDLVDKGPDVQALDDYIGSCIAMAPQPLVMH